MSRLIYAGNGQRITPPDVIRNMTNIHFGFPEPGGFFAVRVWMVLIPLLLRVLFPSIVPFNCPGTVETTHRMVVSGPLKSLQTPFLIPLFTW